MPNALGAAIGATQGTRLGPFVSPQTFELTDASDSLASGEREYGDGPQFFSQFPTWLTGNALRGQTVLDLGCGYGGRTVYYATEHAAEHVSGIEISEAMIDRCQRFARRKAVENVSFSVGFGEALTFPDDHFEAVVSYDVMEHVSDPSAVLGEIRRVLRPGGRAWLAFPTYLGARASHLDYLTQIPMLHRLFDPDMLVEVVNQFLSAEPDRYGVNPQPRPRTSPLGRRALPTLNGLSHREAMALVRRWGLKVISAETCPIVTPNARMPGAQAIIGLTALAERLGCRPEFLIGQIRLVLDKPG